MNTGGAYLANVMKSADAVLTVNAVPHDISTKIAPGEEVLRGRRSPKNLSNTDDSGELIAWFFFDLCLPQMIVPSIILLWLHSKTTKRASGCSFFHFFISIMTCAFSRSVAEFELSQMFLERYWRAGG